MSKKEETLRKGQETAPAAEHDTDQEAARREKLRRLAEAGIAVFPYRGAPAQAIHDVVGAYSNLSKEVLEEKKHAVEVAGRILSIR